MKRLLSTTLTLLVLVGAVAAAALQPEEHLALHQGTVQVASEDLFAQSDQPPQPERQP